MNNVTKPKMEVVDKKNSKKREARLATFTKDWLNWQDWGLKKKGHEKEEMIKTNFKVVLRDPVEADKELIRGRWGNEDF